MSEDVDYAVASGQAALALVTQLISAMIQSGRLTADEARAIGDAAQAQLEETPGATGQGGIRQAIRMLDAWTQGLHGLRPSKGI